MVQPILGALALIAVATVLGLWLRSRTGRVRQTRPAPDAVAISPADVGADGPFGTSATLLQFSTEFCSGCPQTRRLLGRIAAETPGVAHLDVDLTHRPDLARRFAVLQTPTTLVLDSRGVVRARIGGAPAPAGLTRQLETIIGSTP